MKIVVKVGGSAIAQGLDARRFREYADVIKKLAKDHTVLIVIGGGSPARDYINVSKELGANNSILDYIGIGVSTAERPAAHLRAGGHRIPAAAL